MANFITITQFAEKHSMSRGNVLAFIDRGFIDSVALKVVKRPYLIDEDYCLMRKATCDGVLTDVQLWCRLLIQEMSLTSIVRLCILCGADFASGYGRELLGNKLYNRKDITIFVPLVLALDSLPAGEKLNIVEIVLRKENICYILGFVRIVQKTIISHGLILNLVLVLKDVPVVLLRLDLRALELRKSLILKRKLSRKKLLKNILLLGLMVQRETKLLSLKR